jgi:DNA mismatch repair protein MutS
MQIEKPKLTPLMQQYGDIKSQHLDKILLFRMGDFYEMFSTDAETAAPVLNIALTQRNKKGGDDTKMCGVPYHSIATPIARLLKAGFRVAICDQIEDPATAKGIVKRAVTKILTPGMVYDPETLDQITANYLASYDDGLVAFTDITTGEAFYYKTESESEREEVIALLQPVELVLPSDVRRGDLTILVSRLDGETSALKRLQKYILQLQGEEVAGHLRPFEERSLVQSLRLSQTTLRHLEVFETDRGEKSPTLFSAVDRTRTSAGARQLKQWLAFPLLQKEKILGRQKQIEHWLKDSEKAKRVRDLLKNMGDIERRLGRLLSSAASARDLLALAESLQIGFEVAGLLPNSHVAEELRDLVTKLLSSLVDVPPLQLKEGGMIRKGVTPQLDELIDLSENAQKLLLDFEAREKESTKINSLKVRYNNVFGYYIELTMLHAQKAPEHYRRKQTLVNAERFTTPELTDLERKILSARSRRADVEFEIYQDLRKSVLSLSPVIFDFARTLAEADVYSGLAWLALERDYKKPTLGADKLLLLHSRHPVVEQERGKNFVPNTIELTPGQAMLLTGPNMAGKSTLMRQATLIAILAQIGSYVPAAEAELPLFTKIHSRIGSSDSISEGLSTFMVEMKETAEIVSSSDERSLIIMDEIGRGTSTYDGLSLAQAILEYLVAEKKPYLFFATHYHELTKLAEAWPQITNAHMSVAEKRGEIAFLHSLAAGPANRSYGIHVAKLAKLPAAVTERAGVLLKDFERKAKADSLDDSKQLSFIDAMTEPKEDVSPEQLELIREIASTELSTMTPISALNKIDEWQRKLT